MTKMKSLVLSLMAVFAMVGTAAAEDPTAATIIASVFGWIPVGTLVTSVMTFLGVAILGTLGFVGFKLIKRAVSKV